MSLNPGPMQPSLLGRMVQNKRIGDIHNLIKKEHQPPAKIVNSAVTVIDWHIGQRDCGEVLKDERATYGEQVVTALPPECLRSAKLAEAVALSRARPENRSVEII